MTSDADWKKQALAMADALLERNRPAIHLPESAHRRIKRRLEASLRRRPMHRTRWLQPLVIGAFFMVCGVASGIALDRLVFRRAPVELDEPSANRKTAESPSRRNRAKAKTAKTTQTMQTMIEEKSGGPASEMPVTTQPVQGLPQALPAQAPTQPPLPAQGQPHVLLPAQAPPVLEVPQKVLPPQVLKVSPAREPARVLPATREAGKPALSPQVPAKKLAMHLPATAPPPAPSEDTSLPARPEAVAARPEPAPAEKAPEAKPDEMPRPPEPAAVPAPGGLGEERLLAAAVRALRARGDARSALLALNEYRLRYPKGRLKAEAEVLSVDALTALDRPAEALRMLDGLAFERMPGGDDRRLQRAELRAAVGRFQEAEADFSSVLAHDQDRRQDRQLVERALWGRAVCRLQQGNRVGARLDAADYVRRFPGGRFATQAARLEKPIQP
jgi:hypothetical protein